MQDNRIRLRVQPEITPVRLEDRMDLHAAIDVRVESNLKGLSVAGLFVTSLGIVALVGGCAAFAFNYPAPWYDGTAEAHRVIEAVVLSVAGGIILFFLGITMFFYGRSVIGKGRLDSFSRPEELVEDADRAAAPPAPPAGHPSHEGGLA